MRKLIAGVVLVSVSFTIAAADPAPPRFVLATDPVGLLEGNYTLAGTVVLAKHVALRASFTHGDPTQQYTVGHATLSAPIFLDRALHGPFLEPGVVWESDLVGFDVDTLGNVTDQTAQKWGPEMLVGYQWTYAGHLTLSAAAGVMRVWSPTGGGTESQWYLNAGYAF